MKVTLILNGWWLIGALALALFGGPFLYRGKGAYDFTGALLLAVCWGAALALLAGAAIARFLV